jgi:hypothetical protein
MNTMNSLQRTFVFILLLILVGVVQSCDEKTFKTDVEKHGLNGKVKTVKTAYHTFSEKFGEIQIGPRWGWGEFYDWIFEKNGDAKEELQYNYEYELEFKYIYKRNENRTKCEINTYNSDGDLDNKCVEEYDNSGKIIKESYFYPNDEVGGYKLYKYDNRNQLIEELSFNKDASFEKGQMNKYDERGLKTEEITFNSKEAKEKNNGQKTIFKYNSHGNLIEETNLDSDGECLTVISYSYNSRAQISEREAVNINRSNKFSSENTKNKDLYERLLEIRGKKNKDIYTKYDNKGNWIEQLKYKDSKPDFAIVRSIEYY